MAECRKNKKRHAAAIILCNPPINTLSFLLNFVIEPAGQKQVLSHKYPCCHNKGAGGVCQVSFFVSMLSATCMTPFVVNSLFLDFLVYLVYL
ncbi:MAG: hypothetical protein ACEY3L_00920, partial [Wolbachia sp.]